MNVVFDLFYEVIPLLGAHTLLRQRKLEALRDYPRDIMRISYQSHAPGLLYGGAITIEQQIICIAPAVLLHDSRTYFLHETARIPYAPSEAWRYVCAHFAPPYMEDDCEIHTASIQIDTEPPIASDTMELCRFKLKAGAYLRLDYQDFFDMETEFDTVNLLHAPSAAPVESTLHPEITLRFAQEALAYQAASPLDYAFCMRCLEGSPVPRRSIIAYLAQRTNAPESAQSLYEIYKALCRVMTEVRRGSKIGHARRVRERAILVE